MTIDEAIYELQNQCCVPNSEFQKPEYQAKVLGIEALKAIKGIRDSAHNPDWLPLPGETKD